MFVFWFRTFPPRLAFTCNSKMSDRELTGHLHHLVLPQNNSDFRFVWKLNSFCVFVCVLFHFCQMLMIVFPFIYLNIIPPIPPHTCGGYVWRRWLVLGSLILFHFVVPRHRTKWSVTTTAALCLFESSFAADYGVNRPLGFLTSD